MNGLRRRKIRYEIQVGGEDIRTVLISFSSTLMVLAVPSTSSCDSVKALPVGEGGPSLDEDCSSCMPLSLLLGVLARLAAFLLRLLNDSFLPSELLT